MMRETLKTLADVFLISLEFYRTLLATINNKKSICDLQSSFGYLIIGSSCLFFSDGILFRKCWDMGWDS
jgi:hypothetical protein